MAVSADIADKLLFYKADTMSFIEIKIPPDQLGGIAVFQKAGISADKYIYWRNVIVGK